MLEWRIAVWSLVALLVIRIMHHLWQKVSVARTGERFQFLLTRLKFEREVTWRDVRYSFLVVFDSAVGVFLLAWLFGQIF